MGIICFCAPPQKLKSLDRRPRGLI